MEIVQHMNDMEAVYYGLLKLPWPADATKVCWQGGQGVPWFKNLV